MDLQAHRVKAGSWTRREFLRLAGAGAAAGLIGCAAGGESLRVAMQRWCGYQFIRLAQESGWVEHDVELLPQPTAADSVRAIASGAVHAAALTLDEVLRLEDLGVGLVVVLVCDVSAGADVILARPDWNGFGRLRGSRIGVESTSLGTIMLTRLLEAADLRAADVEVVRIGEDHLGAWETQSLDLVLTYEPARTELQRQGLVPFFDSRALPQTLLDVLAVRRDAAARHGGALRSLVAGHFRGLRAWRTNPIDTAYRLAPYIGLPPERVPRAYEGLDLPDADYNRHYLSGPSEELIRTTQELSRIMLRAGLLQGPVAASRRLYSAAYLPESAA
jgi:NitT/TauT family transport system substrate-binding protein